jgi:hypothetical protein
MPIFSSYKITFSSLIFREVCENAGRVSYRCPPWGAAITSEPHCAAAQRTSSRKPQPGENSIPKWVDVTLEHQSTVCNRRHGTFDEVLELAETRAAGPVLRGGGGAILSPYAIKEDIDIKRGRPSARPSQPSTLSLCHSALPRSSVGLRRRCLME